MMLCTRLLTSMHVVMLAAALVACGDDTNVRPDSGPGGDVDSGPGGNDSGTPPVDSGGGGGSDAGDGGTSGRMCGAPGGACDVIAQNCPSPQTCVYATPEGATEPTTICIAVNMTGGDGATCEFVNDCLPGFTCNDGVCRHYCCMGSSSDCPSGSGQRCVGLVGSAAIGQCTQGADCNVVTNDGCDAGRGCYPFADDGTLGCFSAGTVATEGTACTGLNGCAPGMGCFSRGGMPSVCIRFCRIDMGAADCGGGGRMCAAAGLALPTGFGLCPDAT